MKDNIIKFVTDIHVKSDEIVDDEYMTDYVVGFYNKESKSYYNLDEVDDLYNRGLLSNVIKDEISCKLHLEETYLDYRTAFQVICGLPFGKSISRHQNLLDYCYNHNITKKESTPVEMTNGTKYLNILPDDKYTLIYEVDSEVWKSLARDQQQLFKKICIGKFNSLRFKPTVVISSDNSKKEIYTLNFEDIHFINRSLVVESIDKSSMSSDSLIYSFIDLDMQLSLLQMSQNTRRCVFNASKNFCKNILHPNYLKMSGNNEDSDIYWYLKDRK